MGYNGAIALSSPIDLDIDCSPKAIQLIKAIECCDDAVQLHLTESKRLAVKSGNFLAYVECLPQDTEYPEINPDGEEIEIDGAKLLDCFTTLAPYIADDASRSWARGILLRDESAFATNNITLVEKWMGTGFPTCNIPEEAILELIRIGQPPSRIQGAQGSITFHFDNGRWLRSQLLTTEWPYDAIQTILNQEGGRDPIPEGLFRAIEKILPFQDDLGAGFFLGNRIATNREEGIGASVEVPGLPLLDGAYNLKQLMNLEPILKTITFRFPEPSTFYGENLRGAIVGMRL